MGNCCSDEKLSKCSMDNTPELTLTGTSCHAKVLEVYDADTVTLAFSFNKKIYRKRCRLYGVDCAEIRTKNPREKEVGLIAKKFVTDLLLNKVVWVVFKKEDKYGRLLGRIYLTDSKKDSVDEILVSKKYGYVYYGMKKREFSDWYV